MLKNICITIGSFHVVAVMSRRDDDLAYGHFNPAHSEQSRGIDGDKGIVGDTLKILKDTYKNRYSPGPYSGQVSLCKILSCSSYAKAFATDIDSVVGSSSVSLLVF